MKINAQLELLIEIERLERNGKIALWLIPSLVIALFLYGDLTSPKSEFFVLKNMKELSTYFEATAGIISAIIGLAIPISLNVIQMIQAKYRTPRLTKDFVEEPIYRAQLVLIFLNVGLIVAGTLVESGVVLMLSIIIFAITIVCFILFIFMINKYASNLEVHLGKKYRKSLKDYFAK